jgi:type II secretory ATPase GspE/PulE/Tfp pilus assembly ATPase PilB-like protein
MNNNRNFEDILSEEIVKSSNIGEQAVKACRLESEVNGESLSSALVRNGFIKQTDIVEIILRINPDGLLNEEEFAPHVPVSVIKQSKTMIKAIKEDKVYLSTGKSELEAKEYFQKFFPLQEILFVPFDKMKFEDYLQKITDINRPQEGENLDALLRKAIQNEASDIHILPNYDTYSISFRMLGVRYIQKVNDIVEFNPLVAQIKDRSTMDLSETRTPQDGSFGIEYNSRMIDFRVVTVPAQYGETIVIRILDPENAQTSLDTIGISNIEDWRKGMSRANGLCLICGPTGSGKTTTLNSSMKELDRFGKAIFSVEDPVEYKLPYITQVSANPSIGLDFQEAVKAFMRSDPDIIIVGEVRDLNTAQNMMKAAETGHLVFATLHTETIRGAITRLKDIGVDVNELKYMLRSVLVQNLVRVPCKNCWGKGCDGCGDKGYTGRTVVSECAYFPNQKSVEELLLDKEPKWDSIITDAYLKLKAGKTSNQELIRVYGEEARDIMTNNIEKDYQEVLDKKISIEHFNKMYEKMAQTYIEKFNSIKYKDGDKDGK